MRFDPVLLATLAFVLWWLYKLGAHYLWNRPRDIWKGSEFVTDITLLDFYREVWWETYYAIAPAERVHHQPTPYWRIYTDAKRLPGGFVGYWMRDQRCIFFTAAHSTNRQLIRHECAHDILNSIEHPSSYFQPDTYILRPFSSNAPQGVKCDAADSDLLP